MTDTTKLYGFYRAIVTEVDIERNLYGAVKVMIPDLMDQDTMKKSDSSFNEKTGGILAYPANNPLGGFNKDDLDSSYCTTVYVPPKGSIVWVFFEGGDPSRPFYFSGFKYRQATLPPENLAAVKPHKVYTVIKSGEGRSVIVSDSPERPRVEISGKRRLLPLPPSGNPASAFTIDGNMTVIQIDETPGMEQVLIKTYKGDFIQIMIEQRTLNIQMESDITIQTNGNFILKAKKNIQIQSDQNITTLSKQDTGIHAQGSVCITSVKDGVFDVGSGTIKVVDELKIIGKQYTVEMQNFLVNSITERHTNPVKVQSLSTPSIRCGSLTYSSLSQSGYSDP